MGATQLEFTFKKESIFNYKNGDYSKYSKFNSKDDFDKQWEMIMADYKKKFTKKQHEFLAILRRRAVKFPGVALASYSTYADDYEKYYGCTISEDTMRRAIEKAEKLGLLIKNFGKRMIEGHGSQTANVIIFIPYADVMAYKIVQEAKTQAEINKFIEEEQAKTQKMMNWATEVKQLTKKNEDQQQPAAENKNDKPEKAPQSNRKELSMYQRMINTYKPRNEEQKAKFNELMAVAYSTKKRAMNEHGLYATHVEKMILSAFEVLLNKKNVNNQAAMFSVIIKNKINNYLGEQVPTKKGGYVEKVPQWLFEQREARKGMKGNEGKENGLEGHTEAKNHNVIDFEDTKKELLNKLRR